MPLPLRAIPTAFRRSFPHFLSPAPAWVLALLLLLRMPGGTPTVTAQEGTNSDTSLARASLYLYNATNGLGSWIWASNTFDGQSCQLWRSFDLPQSNTITGARLRITADNEFILFLDGRELGRGAEWRELFVYNLAPLLPPGRHVLAVQAFNSFSFAGLLLGLRLEFANGSTVEIKSDADWRIVPESTTGWEKLTEPRRQWPAATVRAAFGSPPWWKTPQNINVMPALQPIRLHFWQTGWFQIGILSLCGVVILISLRLMTQLAVHREERWLLQRERSRIARDIHDDLGSRVTQLVLHGEVAKNGLPEDSRTRIQIDQICEEAREVLGAMDEVLWAVNPQRDTLRDFASYVCGYAQQFLQRTAIECRLEVDPEMSATEFDLPLRRNLLLAIKETLNNAVKYSAATELNLQIRRQGNRLLVVVQDNGRGFDPAAVKPGRNGLANLAQRMRELGGTCVLTSQPGQGCRIEFLVPLTHRQRRSWGGPNRPGPSHPPAAAPKPNPVIAQSSFHDLTKC